MRKVLTDPWETETDSPFPGLTTRAYLWRGPNALFYSMATDTEFDELQRLGGVAHQYLSHRDEAGPMLKYVARRFGSTLPDPRDAKSLAVSLERRAELSPDAVISSAFHGDSGVTRIESGRWPEHATQAGLLTRTASNSGH